MKCILNNVQKVCKKKLVSVGIMVVLIRLLVTLISMIKAKGISALIMSAMNGDVKHTTGAAILLFSVLLLGYAVNTAFSIIKEKRMIRDIHMCRVATIEKIFANKLSRLAGSHAGELLESITDDMDTSINYYASTLPELVCGTAQIMLYFFFLSLLNPLTFGILFAVSLLQMIPPIVVTKYMDKFYEETREIDARITEEIIQTHRGLAEIKRNNAEAWIIKRFQDLNRRVFQIDKKNQMLLQGENSMDNLITCSMTYGTYAILGLLTLNGVLPLDISLQAIVISGSFYEAVKSIFDAWQERSVAKVAINRLNKVLCSDEIGANTKKTNDKIRFMDFSVQTSDADKPLFSHLNLSIPQGETVIIMGENGTGKSTLMKHLVGMLAAESISFCGMNPDLWSDRQRSEFVFYLPQTEPSFTITAVQLYESFYETSKERAAMARSIAEQFNLRKDIWSTNIHDMSGGERKKIFIALAFSTPANVTLLLDEPTNSLDRDGIELFKILLKERCGSAIVISHNPAITELPYRKYRLSKEGVVCEESIS